MGWLTIPSPIHGSGVASLVLIMRFMLLSISKSQLAKKMQMIFLNLILDFFKNNNTAIKLWVVKSNLFIILSK
jgi:hypothetical protein